MTRLPTTTAVLALVTVSGLARAGARLTAARGRELLDAAMMPAAPGSYGDDSPEPILYNFDGFELEPVIPLSAETQAERIPVDPTVGFAVGKINPDTEGSTAYYLTDGVYFGMAVVTDEGVVLVDAPQPMTSVLVPAVREIAGEDAVVSHLVYSHAHQDHISGAGAVIAAFPDAEIIAHEHVGMVLTKRADPNRPVPTFTFTGNYTLTVAGVVVELVTAPSAHTPGDLFVFVPSERVAMMVDVVFPGWTPFRSVAIGENPGMLIDVHDELLRFEADTFVCGHLTRLGNRADVELSKEFYMDLFDAAGNALASVDAAAVAPEALAAGHLWLYTSQLGRTWSEACFTSLKPKWTQLVAGFDVYGRSHCTVIVDYLRIE